MKKLFYIVYILFIMFLIGCKKEYTVYFMNDNDVYCEVKVTEGEEITIPNNPTKEGYIFKGWDVEIPDVMPEHDLTINAKWLSKETIKLSLNDTIYIGDNENIEVLYDNIEDRIEGITFISSDNSVASVTGSTVTGVSIGTCDVQALYDGNVILEKTITVTSKEQEELEQIVEFFNLINDTFRVDTALPSKVNKIYDVYWEVEENEHCEIVEKDGIQYIKVLDQYEWNLNEIKLKVTVYGLTEGVKAQKVFSIYVKRDKREVYTVKEVMESIETNIFVELTGTVYYVCPQGFWLTDETGYTIYVYNKTATSDDVAQGDKVKVIGKKILYYTMYEIENPTVEVLEKASGVYDLSSMIKDNTIDTISTYDKDYKYEYGRIYTISGKVVKDPNDKYTYALLDEVSGKYVVFYDSAMNDLYKIHKDLEENLDKNITIDVLVWDHYYLGFVRVLPISEIK